MEDKKIVVIILITTGLSFMNSLSRTSFDFSLKTRLKSKLVRERLFVKLSPVVMRIISKSFEVSARKITQRKLLLLLLNKIY